MNLGKHIMFDCESLSTRPNALLLQIAALPFDPWAPLGQPCFGAVSFDAYLDWTKWEVEANACHVDLATVNWWLMQSPEAQARIVAGKPRLDAMKAADELVWFLKENTTPDTVFWSFGAPADLVWLRHFLCIAGYPNPWSYRNARCLRTIAAEYDPMRKLCPDAVTLHDALSDAVAQAEWLRRIYRTHRTVEFCQLEPFDYGPAQHHVPLIAGLGGDS